MTARPTRLILLAARHAAAVRLLLLGLLLLSAAAIAFGHFSSDISRMLPDSSVSAQTYRAVARSGMFNSVALLFLLPEGKTFAQSGLGPCLDRLAESLRNLPAVESVDFKIAGDFSGSIRELAIRIPQIYPVPDTDPETAARKVYRQMMTPAAFGRGEMLQLDPFGELADLLRNLERFREISGMSVSLKYPYLVAQDESAAMTAPDLGLRGGFRRVRRAAALRGGGAPSAPRRGGMQNHQRSSARGLQRERAAKRCENGRNYIGCAVCSPVSALLPL